MKKQIGANASLFSERQIFIVSESAAVSPSPCTQGEGRGEGRISNRAILPNEKNPHPNPLPEYRERGLIPCIRKC
jgi:hypothetical protein